MDVPALTLSSIPIHQLSGRRLHLGPFGSGRDLTKFLCFAIVGAAVAALSSVFLWLPFLGVGLAIAYFRVEGQSLDDYALQYCRYRWRTDVVPRGRSHAPSARTKSEGGERSGLSSLRTGGIPLAYLPPADLERIFEQWRSVLSAVDRPLSCRMRCERFSPLPFLPAFADAGEGESGAQHAYAELVRSLLRNRYRRVVDLVLWSDPTDPHFEDAGPDAPITDLAEALERLGIPTARVSTAPRRPRQGRTPAA